MLNEKTKKFLVAAMLEILITSSFVLSTLASKNKDIISESFTTVDNNNKDEQNENQIQKELNPDCSYRSNNGGRRSKNCKQYRNHNANQNLGSTRNPCCK